MRANVGVLPQPVPHRQGPGAICPGAHLPRFAHPERHLGLPCLRLTWCSVPAWRRASACSRVITSLLLALVVVAAPYGVLLLLRAAAVHVGPLGWYDASMHHPRLAHKWSYKPLPLAEVSTLPLWWGKVLTPAAPYGAGWGHEAQAAEPAVVYANGCGLLCVEARPSLGPGLPRGPAT